MVDIKPRTAAPPVLSPTFTVTTGKVQRARRVVLYGPGGVGKSTLASLTPTPIVFDIEGGTATLDIARVDGIKTWEHLLAAVRDTSLTEPYETVVVDGGTKSQEFAEAWTLANIPNDKGAFVKNVEAYGFGKGYQFVHDTFLHLLAELDRLVERGKNVVFVCHECTSDTPNPNGDDFLRYEMRLQQMKSGKASIRDKVFEWADVVGYVSFDVLAQDGKARGNGTRTVYFDARPAWKAKGRGDFAKVIPWNDSTNAKEVWKCLL